MKELNIHDLFIIKLNQGDDGFILLKDNDHLLRRFGQLEYREMQRGVNSEYLYRYAADEIWSVLNGEILARLIDLREDSPTKYRRDEIILNEREPVSLLIPFGVAYTFEAKKDSKLIRLATNVDGSDERDRTYSPDEIEDLLKLRSSN